MKKAHEDLEVKIADACQHVVESTTELDAVAKSRKLGVVIEQL